MTIEEYFGDWCSVIDLKEADVIMKSLASSKQPICPKVMDVFKAFRLCSLGDLRVCIIGQDPYSNYRKDKPIATGIAFGNSIETLEEDYSPSLEILKESIIDFSIPHKTIIFDPTFENLEKQGVLLINSSLSCIKDKTGSHTLLWRPFMRSFLTNLSNQTIGIIYVLMGNDAQSLQPYINPGGNHILVCSHPAHYARTNSRMPSDIWRKIDEILISQNGYGIKWFIEQ